MLDPQQRHQPVAPREHLIKGQATVTLDDEGLVAMTACRIDQRIEVSRRIDKLTQTIAFANFKR